MGILCQKMMNFLLNIQKNKLQIVANFTGSAGFILILKNSNHLFVDGRYTLQAKQQSGKKFIIHEIPYVLPKNILKNKTKIIGFDPKIFTSETLKTYFGETCNLIPINKNLFQNHEIINKNNLVYSIDRKLLEKVLK